MAYTEAEALEKFSYEDKILALTIECPACRAPVGANCVALTDGGHCRHVYHRMKPGEELVFSAFHDSRWQAARK